MLSSARTVMVYTGGVGCLQQVSTLNLSRGRVRVRVGFFVVVFLCVCLFVFQSCMSSMATAMLRSVVSARGSICVTSEQEQLWV